MGYSMIFETKIVKLSDGRIIHFDLSGCNNDECGRKRSDFVAIIYERDAFLERANKFKKDSIPAKDDGGFDLKIQGKYSTYYDYGEHLLRMYNKALTWEELVSSRHTSFRKRVFYPEVNGKLSDTPLSYKEFSESNAKYGRYKMEYVDITTEEDFIKALENGDSLYIYIERPRKK